MTGVERVKFPFDIGGEIWSEVHALDREYEWLEGERIDDPFYVRVSE